MTSTRTLIFGIFVLASRKLTAAQVIALAKPLKISATNVKSHLTRMVGNGALQRSGPVRQAVYWPSQSQSDVIEAIKTRLKESRSERWDRTWLVLILQMPSNRGQRETLRASLWFDGFRAFAANTFVRPAWPLDWTLRKARQYLSTTRGSCMRGEFVGAVDAGAIYELGSLNREALRTAQWIKAKRVPPSSSGSAAFALRLRAGGLVARLIGHAPQLPPLIWGAQTGVSELANAFRKFETRIAPLSQKFLVNVIRTTER